MSTSTSEGVELRRIREPRAGRPAPKQVDTIGVRATPAWGQWLARFAEAAGATRQGIIGAAVAALAESVGYEAPPPRL
jgi:hypothetical protein